MTKYCHNDSAFWSYYSWCQEELFRWEEEQHLAEQEEAEPTNYHTSNLDPSDDDDDNDN